MTDFLSHHQLLDHHSGIYVSEISFQNFPEQPKLTNQLSRQVEYITKKIITRYQKIIGVETLN